jgi:two-component system, OmpR family, KDP operon response regulator KdpE
MTKILIVDDEPQLRRALDVNLRARDYEVIQAETGEQALRLAASAHPDLIILDLGLPGIDGVDVIAGIRGWTQTPILVLSARETEAQKVAALDVGADDYITKPFGMDELLARVRAVERRLHAAADDTPRIIETPDFTLDLAATRVTAADGSVIHLTPTEWRLLEHLATHEGRLITQRQLLEQVWGPGYDNDTGYLRVHVANLRRKLEPDPSRPRYLHTEPGMGYRFESG